MDLGRAAEGVGLFHFAMLGVCAIEAHLLAAVFTTAWLIRRRSISHCSCCRLLLRIAGPLLIGFSHVNLLLERAWPHVIGEMLPTWLGALILCEVYVFVGCFYFGPRTASQAATSVA
jgi:hypothetical protein